MDERGGLAVRAGDDGLGGVRRRAAVGGYSSRSVTARAFPSARRSSAYAARTRSAPEPLGFPAAASSKRISSRGHAGADRHTIGVVTSIQGKRTFRVTVEGVESHAGTSHARERRDALASAVDVVEGATGCDLGRGGHRALHYRPVHRESRTRPPLCPAEWSFDRPSPRRGRDSEALGDIIPEICDKARGPCDVQRPRALARRADRLS